MLNNPNFSEDIKIKNLLDRIRLLNPEIGAYIGSAGSYENLLRVGITVSNGWLYFTRIEIEKSYTLDELTLKSIVSRFEKRSC